MRKTINGQVIRLALLSSHYKQPLDWNENLINESQSTLDKWYTQFENTKEDILNDELLQPLLEDINTPAYIAKLHLLYDKASKGDNSARKLFLAGCKLIGLLEEDLATWKKFKKSKSKIDENTIKNKIKDRDKARKKGDYKLADNIRKELDSNGVVIEDKGDETIWKYK
jgi:cysteinyl-tRNA synthetase